MIEGPNFVCSRLLRGFTVFWTVSIVVWSVKDTRRPARSVVFYYTLTSVVGNAGQERSMHDYEADGYQISVTYSVPILHTHTQGQL